MLRLTGAALLIGASLLMQGELIARERERRRTLRALSDAFLALEHAVRLTLTPLPALLRTLSCEGAARRFFDAVLEGLARGETLPAAWRRSAAALPLGEREREAAAALGEMLDSGEETVCTALAQTSRTLAEMEGALAAAAPQRSRVTAALCLGGGTLLVIVLL